MLTQRPPSLFFNSIIIIFLILSALLPVCYGAGIAERDSSADPRAAPFYVKFQSQQVSIEPNGSALITVEIENGGTSPDSYDLSSSGVPAGWTALFLDSNGDLEPSIETSQVPAGGQELVTMKITVPVSGQADISVNAISKGGQGTAMGTIKVIIQEDPIKVLCMDPTRKVQSTEFAYYDVIVVNDQAQEDLIKISIDGGVSHHPSQLNSSWTYSINISNTPDPMEVVPAAGQLLVNLTIRPPLKMDGSTNLVIVQVVATSQTTDQMFFSPEIKTSIQEVSALSIAQPSTLEADGGTSPVYTLNLKNEGTADIEVVGPNLKPSSGWNLHPAPTSFWIKPAATYVFQVTVSIPENSKAGLHTTVVSFKIEGTDVEVLVNLTTKVNQVRNLEVNASAEVLAGIPIDMGTPGIVEIEAKNLGNGDDTLTMEISDLVQGWSVITAQIRIGSGSNITSPLDFQGEIDLTGYTDTIIKPMEGTASTSVTLKLGAGQMAHIGLEITPGEQVQGGSSRFTIYWHRSPGVEDRMFLTTNLRLSNLEIKEVKVPTEIHADDRTEILVTVVNNFTQVATDIQVKLFVDGELEDTANIEQLSPEGSREVTLSFDAKQEHRLIKVIIKQGVNDPNEVESHFTIEVLEPKEGDDNLSLFWWVIVLVLVLLVVLILVFLVKRGTSAPDEQKEDEYQRLYGKDSTQVKVKDDKTNQKKRK